MIKEIENNTGLEQLTNEHELVLRLCIRIRKGLHRKVNTQRIRDYVDWFRTHYLDPHFELEKEHIFPILGMNVRVKRALANHRRINRLLSCSCEDLKVLSLLEEELAAYTRFEELILYRKIRAIVSPDKLMEIEQHLMAIPYNDQDWKDHFWKD
ncbi:hemerythrin domain-containing protein [Galbibacter sp.]|jgi:hypothetical protein|uniref:hemerythrin domain-containing protein n=1 Tax=Galbibacter sp. TaxID=2918471 RepID=UPI003A91DAB9